MYVPAYPLPIMEIASFVKSNDPETEIEVISIPMDYGLPITAEGRDCMKREIKRLFHEIKRILKTFSIKEYKLEITVVFACILFLFLFRLFLSALTLLFCYAESHQ